MLLIDRNIILLQIKEKHATISTSRTTTKVASIIKEVGITVEEAEKIPGRYFDEKAKR